MTLVDTSVWIDTFRRSHPLDLESVVPFDEIVTCLSRHPDRDFAAIARISALRERRP